MDCQRYPPFLQLFCAPDAIGIRNRLRNFICWDEYLALRLVSRRCADIFSGARLTEAENDDILKQYVTEPLLEYLHLNVDIVFDYLRHRITNSNGADIHFQFLHTYLNWFQKPALKGVTDFLCGLQNGFFSATLSEETSQRLAFMGINALDQLTLRSIYPSADAPSSLVFPNFLDTFYRALHSAPVQLMMAAFYLKDKAELATTDLFLAVETMMNLLFSNDNVFVATPAFIHLIKTPIVDAVMKVSKSGDINAVPFEPLYLGNVIARLLWATHRYPAWVVAIRDDHAKSRLLKDLAEADEVFLTGSTKRIAPVIQIDNYHYPIGKVTEQLYNLLLEKETKEARRVIIS